MELARSEGVEATVIGTFGTDSKELILSYRGTEVGRMSMEFLHDGIPMPTRRAVVGGRKSEVKGRKSEVEGEPSRDALLKALADPNVASKHWIIKQYDHEVQGQTIVKPLGGPTKIGPSDAAVLRPKASSSKGVVLAKGLAPHVDDPYEMALASIDEAIRNAVCVGASLDRLAILDNFCWPGVHDEASMGTLVRAAEGCRDGALAYRVPFISGKDSLHNQFVDAETGKTIRIPCTLLISAIGVIDDVAKVVTSPFKAAGNHIFRVACADDAMPLAQRVSVHRLVESLIAAGVIRAAHDISDGGAIVTISEMCIGSGLGASLRAPAQLARVGWFTHHVAGYVLEIDASKFQQFFALTQMTQDVRAEPLGKVTAEPRLIVHEEARESINVSIDDLTRAWRGTLDW